MLILDKIAENVDYSENFRKMSTWVKICKYLEFSQNFQKSRFLLKFSKILISAKIVENSEISKNIDVGQNSPKCRFWS